MVAVNGLPRNDKYSLSSLLLSAIDITTSKYTLQCLHNITDKASLNTLPALAHLQTARFHNSPNELQTPAHQDMPPEHAAHLTSRDAKVHSSLPQHGDQSQASLVGLGGLAGGITLPLPTSYCRTNILYHLQRKPGGQWDLDRECNDRDKADISAYTSFIETHGQSLVDLSFYVSSENYHASTRPAYSNLLRWPNTWLLPPKRRAAARARTDHLNLSSLDLDTWNGDGTNKARFAAGAEIPKLARSTQQTVSSLAKQPQHATRFRLDTLAEAFFEPLAQLLQGERYLLHDERMTSLDCLALGYLSLALVPEMPQSWLSQSMKSRYRPLCRYVEHLSQDCFGKTILQIRDHAGSERETGKPLPWKDPQIANLKGSILNRSSLESLPYVGALYHPNPLQPSTTTGHDKLTHVPVLPTMFVGLAASVTALASYVLYTGETPPFFHLNNWPSLGRQRSSRLVDLGEAGAMLGAIRFRP
ncbi:MAG: hypothetical protein Q9206_002714 [Seirophora lacunosa]